MATNAVARGGQHRRKPSKRMLWKDIRSTFGKSKGRFLSIACLIMLGSFALVGLKVTGPDMRATSANYFGTYDMADIAVIGDLGIDEDDRADIAQATGVREVEYGYLKDLTVSGTTDAVRIESAPENVSQFEVKEGRLPEADDEIAIDSFMADDYPLGSTISFDEEEGTDGSTTLTRHEFTVVGYVGSMDIITTVNRGNTTVGTGDLTGYAVVSPDVFDVDYYMICRLTYDDTEGLDPYGAEYLEKVSAHKDELSDLLSAAPQRRLDSVRAEYDEKINDGQAEIDDARQQLADAKATLDDAAQQLEDGRATLAESWSQLESAASKLASARSTLSSSRSQLVSAQEKLATSRSTLDDGWAEYNDGVAALASAKQAAEEQISSAQETIDTSRAKLEAGKTAYEQGIAQLEAAIAQAQAAGADTTALEAQLAQTKAAYDAFMNADAGSSEDGADGGYTALIAQLDAAQQQLDAQKSATETQVAEKQATLDAAKTKLENGESEYSSGVATYNQGRVSYDAGVEEYNEGLASYNEGLQTYYTAAGTLEEKQSEYEDGLAEYNEELPDAEQKIADGEADLADARQARDEVELPDYDVDSRRETPGSEGYVTYNSTSEIVDSLANLFPYFLYAVAALVASTTMTRMVDEERINAGTLKALGYDDSDIMKKFVVYGVCAGVLGSVVGIILGHTVIPMIAYGAYGAKFSLPTIELHFYPLVSLAALLLGLAVVVVPAVLVAKRELAEKPAQLLLPKAPSGGSKIILERITPIWKRLNFTQKVTCRNLLRYKKRMLMTVIGVAGAVSLIYCGYAVRNSISGLNTLQFGEIINYDLIVAENSHVSESEQAEIDDQLKSSDIADYSAIHYESASKEAGSKGDTQSINLLVPEDVEEFTQYLSIRERVSGEEIELPSEGAVISERLADLLGVSVGDEMTFDDSDGVERTVEVAGICEMYMNHFMFMSPEAYTACTGKQLSTNAYVVTLNDKSTENTRKQAAEFIELDGVLGCVQSSQLIEQINIIVASLNKIMMILIAIAVLLGVVIVYNLVTINVAERIRELSTIKVLGFYDNEVSMYIYRETIINSLIALPVGWLLGWLLQQRIITAVPPETVMFDPSTGTLPYIVSTVVVAAVTVVMYVVVNRQLRDVDMLEALKSVD
jgi:putative ABC transport system permease protein